MADALVHRGPDGSGTFADERAGLALGHRRLSILDLSEAGAQPMTSADGRYVIAYNGEVYNAPELRTELERSGPRPRGRSDTEVVLEGFARFGVAAFLPRLVGMFAIALWDRRERELWLVRDRLGVKPLYFGAGAAPGALAFGSELRALVAAPGFERRVDEDALALYLRYGYVPAPHSIWRGVRKLEPGTYARFRGPAGEPEIVRYWDLGAVAAAGLAARGSEPRASESDYASELEARLKDSIRGRLLSDVPLGAFLSGGIDSSVVAGLMTAIQSGPVRTFTAGFDDPDLDEAAHAAGVARHLGCEHTELRVRSRDAVERVDELPELWDEPFADPSALPTWLIAKEARKHVTVCLSGDGGDELLGGYTRYAWLERLHALERLPRALRRGAGELLARPRAGVWNKLDRAFARVAPAPLAGAAWSGRVHRLGEHLRHDRGSLHRGAVSLWNNPSALLAHPSSRPEPDPSERLLASLAGAGTVRERAMLADAGAYLPEDILCKVDRASMAVGLEARVPLLDHRVVEFLWTVPPDVRIGDWRGKRLLRSVLDRHVPRELIDRPKRGFSPPIDAWLRGPLRDWGEALLAQSERSEHLHAAPVRALWNEHQAERRVGGPRLWAVLMLQSWANRWL